MIPHPEPESYNQYHNKHLTEAKPMTWDEYKEKVKEFKTYPPEHEAGYLYAGYWSEIGEVAGLQKRVLRGDFTLDKELNNKLIYEIGDCLWYLAVMESVSENPAIIINPKFVYENGGVYELLPDVLNLYLEKGKLLGLIRVCGMDVSEVMRKNIEKLTDRKARGTLHGSGDER